MRSAAGHQHTLKLQHKCHQNDNHVQRQIVYIMISLTHSYGKEKRRERCRRFARLHFCKVVYNRWRHEIPRYTGITAFLRRYIIVGHFLIPRIPTLSVTSTSSTKWLKC